MIMENASRITIKLNINAKANAERINENLMELNIILTRINALLQSQLYENG